MKQTFKQYLGSAWDKFESLPWQKQVFGYAVAVIILAATAQAIWGALV